jgi:beta-galactosidase beta subunit
MYIELNISSFLSYQTMFLNCSFQISSNVYGDSSNVIKCMQGKFRIGNKMLMSILEQVKLAETTFTKISYHHMYIELNISSFLSYQTMFLNCSFQISSNVYGDSSNVIKCTQGRFKIGNKMLMSILEQVKLAETTFAEISYHHMYIELNISSFLSYQTMVLNCSFQISSNVYGDSSNVIKCTQGRFRIGNKMLMSILEQVKLTETTFAEISYHHMYIELNIKANYLAKEGMKLLYNVGWLQKFKDGS